MVTQAKRNTATYTLIQILCSIVMFMVVAYAGLLKMEEEFWQLFQWWGATVILGLAFYPLSAMIFRRFDDRGYLFSKAIGLVVTGWLMWLLASLKILPFTTQNCYWCLGACVLCNYTGVLICWLRKRKESAAKASVEGGDPEGDAEDTAKQEADSEPEQKKKGEENEYTQVFAAYAKKEESAKSSRVKQEKTKGKWKRAAAKEKADAEAAAQPEECAETGEKTDVQSPVKPHWERILVLELLFFMLFVAYMYMKGFNPKAYGTEKMMDYGFMMSMFKTEYFPVEDFWFAGEGLNYYYFGQYIMTFLTKVSFNTVSYGYNLALGTGFAFCATLVYALVCQVMRVFIAQRKKKISDAVSHVAGALAAIAVTIAGNGHYIVFNWLVPMLWDTFQIPGDRPSYWFPNSTRYIGYTPDTHDKTIHEFPSYSFILGDVHAHVVNITFVLTLTAILFSFLMNRQEAMKAAIVKRRKGEKTEVSLLRETFRLPVIAVGYLIGIFMMSNYWDFPIYFVVAGAVILTSNAMICGFDIRTWFLTAMHAIVVLAVAFLVALPFNSNFVAMANGILLAETHTAFYQLIILWGLQFVIVIGFVTALIWREIQRNKKKSAEKTTEKSETAAADLDGDSKAELKMAKQNRFVCFLENLAISDLFILILGLCAIGLVLTPEVIYMSDIYAGDYKRSNTMFKLVYQAFILFGISIGYILTRFVLLKETRRQFKWGIAGIVLLLWTCGYFGTSVRAWFGDLRNEDNYKGMRADRYIFEEQPTDAVAIAWLNENVEGRPVILEANGESYTIDNRVSVLTGLPTVLGWRVHEWLWHNSLDPVSVRAAEVQTMYTSQDQELVRALLNKYKVTYLFIGSCEYEKYAPIGMNTEMLRQLGEVVYEGYPDMQGRVVMIVKVR